MTKLILSDMIPEGLGIGSSREVQNYPSKWQVAIISNEQDSKLALNIAGYLYIFEKVS